ncbi:hypothetical protein LTR78_003427 [Recurvomyces mirabilis]|uniref:SnoaL-like domain-containing protein n=1 Tax=Recurvomyces mirabilis TaxID=574656 RepID=A0AAE1C3D6_9PEZI|nr:hypothetical protein LTR78_003427 [Recurvomyces mirabilis]KAK5154539.1 hypothetical protein LTS14_006676 [Recurvomyces mirabilis]
MEASLQNRDQNDQPPQIYRNNGTDAQVLERLKLRELAEGWVCYRDACEWENFRSIFAEAAYVYTTWSGKFHVDDFIEASKMGVDQGVFIMHRAHGVTSNLHLDAGRAVTKMKATITQRFELDGCEVDAEADCRFIFFFEKQPSTGDWLAKYVRHWYEKDKLIPVDPRHVPMLDDEILKSYPRGYRYLAHCQQRAMGITISKDLPGHARDGGTINGSKHDLLYEQAVQWLAGEDIAF